MKAADGKYTKGEDLSLLRSPPPLPFSEKTQRKPPKQINNQIESVSYPHVSACLSSSPRHNSLDVTVLSVTEQANIPSLNSFVVSAPFTTELAR